MLLDKQKELQEVLLLADAAIHNLIGHTLDVVDIKRPPDVEYGKHLAKVISKLSPLLGNMIEFSVVSELNKFDWSNYSGKWLRQDPGFPDAIFNWDYPIKPGMEVKAWFPLATEITARFRDSITFFGYDQTNVAVLAWLPEYLIYGKPKIIDVWIDTGKSLALARDLHYHNPPDYLVVEPEDTAARTRNLQQTNVVGYKFQGDESQFLAASGEVNLWGDDGREYSADPGYQQKIKSLLGKYTYRIDTNFSKMDRIGHVSLEQFKSKVLAQQFLGRSIQSWARDHLVSDEDLTRIIELGLSG